VYCVVDHLWELEKLDLESCGNGARITLAQCAANDIAAPDEQNSFGPCPLVGPLQTATPCARVLVFLLDIVLQVAVKILVVQKPFHKEMLLSLNQLGRHLLCILAGYLPSAARCGRTNDVFTTECTAHSSG
jgi:hypothetical protein